MSEDIRAWIREQRFGHIVVQTDLGEVLSLDLFETPDLVCRGYYMPPPGSALRREEESPLESLLRAPAVELRASQAAIEELLQSSFIQTNSDQDSLFFELNTPRLETYGELALVSQRSEAGPEVWTGRVNAGQLSFVLERYDSSEIVILITLIFVLLRWDRRAAELDYECWSRAVEMCGERRIKRYTVRRNLMGLSESSGFGHDCEIECM